MTKIFGILNITPDSFSDGGLNCNKETALKAAKKMINDGVYAIDVGAESTRPNATILNPQEEIARLSPILPELIKLGTKVSLDTRNFETAKWGALAGISILNDVSGFTNQKMIELVAKYNLEACFMHSLTIPADPKVIMEGDIMTKLYSFAEEKIAIFKQYGISKERLMFDVGIGFGKTAEQSIFILQNIEYFKKLNVRLFVGHSRKSFLKSVFGEVFENDRSPSIIEKDLMTAIISSTLLGKVDFLRLHNTSILSTL
jgi:dihydropteroate synthase